jgi:hypothetical protein
MTVLPEAILTSSIMSITAFDSGFVTKLTVTMAIKLTKAPGIPNRKLSTNIQ